MGKLKPIGSEKLEGMDKIMRMIEISQYKLNIPKPINEVSSNEYKKLLADGNTYHIVKEKNGYVLKKGLSESNSVYVEPMKGRNYYKSYSQALKRLNIITNEISRYEGYNKNISLFLENDDEVNYYLTTEQEETPDAAPALPPPPGPAPEGGMGGEMPPMPEEPVQEPQDSEIEPMDMEDDDEDEVVTFKTIQKTTGKLAQKIRAFLSDEENEMTSEDTKYVINSVLSALDLSSLDEEDMDEIMAKFEGEEGMEEPSMGGEEDMGMEEPSMGGEEGMTPPPPAPGEGMTPPPPAPEGSELAEHYLRRTKKRNSNALSESTVDKVLGKYFGQNPKKKSNNSVITKIQNLSESFKQEVQSVKFINENNDFKLLGKNKQGYLVFENEYERVRVSPKGNVI